MQCLVHFCVHAASPEGNPQLAAVCLEAGHGICPSMNWNILSHRLMTLATLATLQGPALKLAMLLSRHPLDTF